MSHNRPTRPKSRTGPRPLPQPRGNWWDSAITAAELDAMTFPENEDES